MIPVCSTARVALSNTALLPPLTLQDQWSRKKTKVHGSHRRGWKINAVIDRVAHVMQPPDITVKITNVLESRYVFPKCKLGVSRGSLASETWLVAICSMETVS